MFKLRNFAFGLGVLALLFLLRIDLKIKTTRKSLRDVQSLTQEEQVVDGCDRRTGF